jgi:DNA end-binding protein Ku
MARAIWTGSLSFGLVNVPVGLFSATDDKSIHFNQFQAGTADRVRNKRVNERTGDEVPYDQIVKGYDLGGGEFVLITPEELAAVAPGRSRTIDVTDFVDLADIDPVYFDKPYVLAPQGKGTDRAYALLLEALRAMNKVAIAQFVMRDKQYLVAIRPGEKSLVLETLRFADEVRDAGAEIDGLPVEATFDDKELDMARLLIDAMATDWEPERYGDSYRERVEQLIEDKRNGAVVSLDAPSPTPAPVVDLMEALQASVQAAQAGGRALAPVAPPSASPSKGRRAKAAPTETATPAKRLRAASRQTLPTKAELAAQAAELDIAGRSKMTREELAEAIEAASSAKRRRRKAS